MEDELEGTIKIENYFHQEEDGEEGPRAEPLGSLSVVDSLTAGGNWPGRHPNWKHHSGPHKLEYEKDSQKRANKQCARKNGLARKCFELATITGGTVFFRFVTMEGKSYVYTSCDELWEEYKTSGLKPLKKEVKMDVDGKDAVFEPDSKWEKAQAANKVQQEATVEQVDELPKQEKVEKVKTIKLKKKTPKAPKAKKGCFIRNVELTNGSVIEIKKDTGQGNDNEENVTEEREVDLKDTPLRVEDSLTKALENKKSQEKLPDFCQVLVMPKSALQFQIDRKFVISSPDVQPESSNVTVSLGSSQAENSGTKDGGQSGNLPMMMSSEHGGQMIPLNLDPSLIHSACTPPSNIPDPQKTAKKKKRKRARSESPEAKQVHVEVRCKICSELYAKRQDNRRYGRWIGCSDCPSWVHAKCVGWTEADIDSAKDFYCKDCSAKKLETDKEDVSKDGEKVEGLDMEEHVLE